MTLDFTKMHALGNDFIVVNAIDHPFDTTSISISGLANRHSGIGFDQFLIIEPSQQADFFCRIFNSDGSEAQQCGNGLRCVARWLHEENLIPGNEVSLETKAGIFPLTIQDYNHIRMTMGAPQIQSMDNSLSVISLGNSHAITRVETLDHLALELRAQQISMNFPDGINVGFMQVMNNGHVKLRTIERGVGETMACGSNACAAAVAGIANGWLQPQVIVEYSQGSLLIDWSGESQPVYLTGPAATVFKGCIT